MTATPSNKGHLSDDEWNELDALRKAICDHLQSVSYSKMERFTELMVRTLEGKSDLRV